MPTLVVRRERSSDRAAARAVQVAAFPTPEDADEPVEAGLLDALRADEGWIPELSWVAELDGEIVGHVVATRGRITADDEATIDAVGLGPIGVLPDLQRSGVGSALLHAAIGAADALGEPLIALLGDPDYYHRFGFVASSEHGVEAPDPEWGPYFQVLPLTGWDTGTTGRFAYAAPFDEL